MNATLVPLPVVPKPVARPTYAVSEAARYQAALKRAPHLSSDARYKEWKATQPVLVALTTTEEIDATFAAQNTEALHWAIQRHLMSDPDLADTVSAEIARKLPWQPVDNPLTPITQSKCSHVVNYLAKKRKHNMQRPEWARPKDVELDAYEKEPRLFNVAGRQRGVSHEEIQHGVEEFRESLKPSELALLDECLYLQRERPGFRALVHKAEAFRVLAETPIEDSSYRLRVSPPEFPRPAGWHTSPMKAKALFTDPWKGRRTKPKATCPDSWEPVPAKLFHQIMTGQQ